MVHKQRSDIVLIGVNEMHAWSVDITDLFIEQGSLVISHSLD